MERVWLNLPAVTLPCIQKSQTPGIPENTVAAMKHALACGADVLEFDVWLTADGQVVVFHDATLARMCGTGETTAAGTRAAGGSSRYSSKGVADLSYADLPPIRVDEEGDHWGVTAANRSEAQRIPLLSEVLAVIPIDTVMIIEFKQKDEVSISTHTHTHTSSVSLSSASNSLGLDPCLHRQKNITHTHTLTHAPPRTHAPTRRH